MHSNHTYYTLSQVYLGRHKETGAFYAIKVLQKEAIIKRSEVELIMAKRSIAIHPFLVGLHCSFQTRTKLYFLLEYVNGGRLSSYQERLEYVNGGRLSSDQERQKNNVFDERSAR